MTRENKLALVVGFGLILFVGILISDHFSVVRTQAPADLSTLPRDPLAAVTANIEPANLIEIKPLQPELPPDVQASNPADGSAVYDHNALHSSVLENGGSAPPAQPTIAMGPATGHGETSIPEGFVTVDQPRKQSPAVTAAETGKFHDVQAGESMFAICKKYYGNSNGDAIDALAKFNKIDDPESIRAGRRLKIPSPQEIGLAATSAESTPNTSVASAIPQPSSLRIVPVASDQSVAKGAPAAKTPTKPAHVTYTVKPGETLRMIALKVMGNKSKWNKLYDLNRDVIDDPDNLKVGTVLRIS